jgi:hypothetical protein
MPEWAKFCASPAIEEVGGKEFGLETGDPNGTKLPAIAGRVSVANAQHASGERSAESRPRISKSVSRPPGEDDTQEP